MQCEGCGVRDGGLNEKPSKICRPPNSQKDVLLPILSQRWVVGPDKLRVDKHAKKLLAFDGIPRYYRVYNGPHVLKGGIGTTLFIRLMYCHFSPDYT